MEFGIYYKHLEIEDKQTKTWFMKCEFSGTEHPPFTGALCLAIYATH